MRNSRRIAALGATVILTATALGGTAVAQETTVDDASASAFNATATADALTINLFGNVITSSAVSAEVKPELATATVTETVLGPVNPPTPATATAEGPDGTAEATTQSCTDLGLTAAPGVARFDLTCGTATARSASNTGAARALGAEVVLEPSVSEVLDTVGIKDPATDTANKVFDGLSENLVEPLTGNALGDLVDDTVKTVQDVLNDVLQLQSTARIVVAPALAEVETTECNVTAAARAQAVRVELLAADVTGTETNGLLPEDLEAGEPLVIFTLADAQDSKSVSRCGGEDTHTFRGALACIELGSTALGETLGLPTEELCLEGGQTVCILEGTPLESCISLAAASSDAGADAASIQVFKGVNGGVDIATGRAATTAKAIAPPQLTQVEQPAELPRTGGPAILPIIGGGLLAAAAVTRRFARKA